MAFKAFILPHSLTIMIQPQVPTPAEIYYLSLFLPALVAWSAFYVATTVIADAFLVSRSHL